MVTIACIIQRRLPAKPSDGKARPMGTPVVLRAAWRRSSWTASSSKATVYENGLRVVGRAPRHIVAQQATQVGRPLESGGVICTDARAIAPVSALDP